jgi:hypothetical protein
MLYSISYAPKEDLHSRITDCLQAGFANERISEATSATIFNPQVGVRCFPEADGFVFSRRRLVGACAVFHIRKPPMKA